MTKEEIFNRIDEFVTMGDNWNGYDGIAVLPQIAERTKSLIEEIEKHMDSIDDIYPNSHGTISIEFLNAKTDLFSLEIGLSSYGYLIKYADNKPAKFVNTESLYKIQLNLTEFHLERYPKLHDLREKSNGQTRLLYHKGFWDGPQSGVMLWNGEKRYFCFTDDYWIENVMTKEEIEDLKEYYANQGRTYTADDLVDCDRVRQFKVYKIDAETMEAIDYNHELFRTYVGAHTDYDENGKRGRGAKIRTSPDEPEDLGDLKPYSEHDKFYNNPSAHKKYTLDLKEENVVGYFEL